MRACLVLALLSSACSVSPLAPTPKPEQWPVSVLVREQGSNLALPDSFVWSGQTLRGYTNLEGRLVLRVPPAEELCVSVTRDGYQPSIVACAYLSSQAETWTFYLWK